jgi:thiol-disulfide isomerase/thioredoxin
MRKNILILFMVIAGLVKGDSFFGFDEVKFFEKPKQITTEDKTKKETEIIEEIFAEPVVGPDGKMRVYVPPKQVLEFLKNPTEENAKAYLKWNQERLEKIVKAQEVLQKVASNQIKDIEEKPSVAKNPSVASIPKQNPSVAKEMVVALSPDCKYCKAQLLVLEAFKNKYPDVKIKLVWFADSKSIPSTTLPVALGKEEDKPKIKKFPTFFFVFPDGKTIAGEGFIDGKRLEEFTRKIGWL